MREWLERQVAAGLPALAGTELRGTIAVNPELINQFIAQWLSAPPSVASSPTPSSLDWSRLRSLIRSTVVRSEANRILIDLDVRV